MTPQLNHTSRTLLAASAAGVLVVPVLGAHAAAATTSAVATGAGLLGLGRRVAA